MQVKQLIALSALALAGTAVLADDITPEPAPFVSTRTRAEVKAEVQQARARGELQPAGEEDVVVAAPQRSTLTRAAVKAEVLQARANGELIPAGEQLAVAHPVQRARAADTLAQVRTPAATH
ncbi:MAG: DUF4148 domain-containing protein [Betaproteobacteria bacterium]|nr:MAG: DUF4148 domain-containing protein [Betaproteobacteria bacterium]TMH14210.1 MAG: DUF4148 domain-containing protein [Betaproteobacteria bacterium]